MLFHCFFMDQNLSLGHQRLVALSAETAQVLKPTQTGAWGTCTSAVSLMAPASTLLVHQACENIQYQPFLKKIFSLVEKGKMSSFLWIGLSIWSYK